MHVFATIRISFYGSKLFTRAHDCQCGRSGEAPSRRSRCDLRSTGHGIGDVAGDEIKPMASSIPDSEMHIAWRTTFPGSYRIFRALHQTMSHWGSRRRDTL